MLSVNRDSLNTFPISRLLPLPSFIALISVLNAVFKQREVSQQSHCISELSEIASRFSPFRMILSVIFSSISLIILVYIPFVICCL